MSLAMASSLGSVAVAGSSCDMFSALFLLNIVVADVGIGFVVVDIDVDVAASELLAAAAAGDIGAAAGGGVAAGPAVAVGAACAAAAPAVAAAVVSCICLPHPVGCSRQGPPLAAGQIGGVVL